ncbi:hypothetical protein ALO82_200006 [Pseudomonas syringae pv. broussonetiae]|nr:hypothetical protein ALO82_200006 [Pseudomonas syringae pv. broussonetiae]
MTSTMIGLLGGAILIPLFLTSIVIAVIAHKYVETIEAHLPNCSYIRTVREAYSGGGLLGKVMRGGVIALILMMPKLSARRGFVDEREIKTFQAITKNCLSFRQLRQQHYLSHWPYLKYQATFLNNSEIK